MTDDKDINKNEENCEDIVNEKNKERQKTMDKLSIDSSVAHTYDKDESEKSDS